MKDIKFIITAYEYAGLETPSHTIIKNGCESTKNINEALKFDTYEQAEEFMVNNLPMEDVSFKIRILYNGIVFCPDGNFNKVVY